MRSFKVLASLALASRTIAQNVTYCPSDNVCYAVNVPETTATSGSGDLFFQISGPSTMSWIGLGQGDSMSGSNIFMVYANAAGNNVTVSPRLGVGDREPTTSGSTSQITLLSGSGISNGQMVANIRCSNCNSWSGGSMSLTDASSSWIWAYRSGAAVSSDSTSVSLREHSSYGSTSLNLQQAAGGNSPNPFATTIATTTPGTSSGSTGSSSSSGPTQTYDNVRMAHAILAPIAFVIFYPLGAIGIRLLSFKSLVYMHAGWMMFTYLIVLASMGMGVWIAVVSKQLDEAHSIIGLVVVGCLLIQPVTGLTHHLLYKRVGRPNAATYPHIWWGRAVITLGIINGGLGLQLSANTKTGEIAYGVVAGVMWLIWMAVIVMAFLRSRNPKDETGEGVFRLRDNESSTRMTGQASPMQRGVNGGERPMSQESTVVAESFYRG
ncbi:hypothetical protein BKA64DRAFT_92005 [Cadophora sp. MPI-SDFR-AT-0126]|nr:hypothetical protein BKA64DRAFT_92005 [Leotiomycetes sp. MPI-SDFR-AT-0126]